MKGYSMPRTARIKAPGQMYSVVTRVNNSEFTFSDFSLCEAFLDHLKQVKAKLGFKLYGFVLMSSHIHLLIEPDDEKSTISDVMFAINGKFSQKYNCFHKRKGHFWMQRFASKIVERGAYFVNTLIYFALNPVRAGICDNPLEFKYSSIQNLHTGIFADLIDELPSDLKETLQEFLKRNNYIELLEKCTRLLKKFSFALKKNPLEQRFKHFCGSSSFIEHNKQIFLPQTNQ
jgi:putative transposase